MSASPKFVSVQHFDQPNAVYNSVKMTSPDRQKDLVLPREVENGIHNDMTRVTMDSTITAMDTTITTATAVKRGSNRHCCYGVCKSDSRYPRNMPPGTFFVPFAKPGNIKDNMTDWEKGVQKNKTLKAERWVDACSRKNFTLENVKKDTYICSLHFVGGRGPTEENPDPVTANLNENELPKLTAERNANHRTYNGGEKSLLEEERRGTYSKVMHTTVRYSVNDMKLNNVGDTFTGEKYNKKEYNMNHTAETIGSKIPHEQLHENYNEKENRIARCDDDLANLTNGRGASDTERVDNLKTVEGARGDSYYDLSSKVNFNENNIDEAIGVNNDLNSIDIIDEEAILINDFEGGAEETKATRIDRQQNKIEQLKENLRCEEATLNILRKLIDSQRGKNGYKPSVKHPPVTPSLHPKQPAQIAPKVAPPLKPQQFQAGKTVIQPAANPAPVQKYYIQVGSQLVPAPPPSTPASGPIYQYANGGTTNSHTTYQPPAPPKPAPPPKQTPEQKQNAAKAALRRQLEQTLLQIPPPRPPPADWKAIPNVNSMDFMMLVGLDEVVDNILDMDMKPTLKNALEELMPYNPRICSQCRVDFSPCWKNKDGNSKDFVLCERCALQNVKKDLKAEHTSRLKSAFLKALKQEQEIEEKIKAGEDVNIGNITGVEKTENSQSPVTNSQPCVRISSPKSAITAPAQPSRNHASNASDSHHQSSTGHHHRQVVQHYPHHSPLVQQLHHQHLQQQQQQLEQDPSSQRHSSRWHPYLPPSSGHHHRDHHQSHHRTYVPVSSSVSAEPTPPHQEYYVVHHPQHAGGVRYINR